MSALKLLISFFFVHRAGGCKAERIPAFVSLDSVKDWKLEIGPATLDFGGQVTCSPCDCADDDRHRCDPKVPFNFNSVNSGTSWLQGISIQHSFFHLIHRPRFRLFCVDGVPIPRNDYSVTDFSIIL